ncbi:MAG TPA: HAD-IIB family hydrolase [Acetobacteraceae bacterium]|nr:HAD-IIB family hydrolase [Acetobacteraceae bacterium]
MYYLALAADYDGTIAKHGLVSDATVQALQALKQTGRRLVLVTGRELTDLRHVFPGMTMFDRIVGENGAVIYNPATSEERALAPPPPPALVHRLIERGVQPISVGHAIVATWQPHDVTALEVIRELGLELHIVFNKGAVMILPTHVNKAFGLRMALEELDISPRNVVAVGDAENDHAFLHACGCAAAVANALPALRDTADITLQGDHGHGVAELAQMIAERDGGIVPPSRRGILAGKDRAGEPVYLEPESLVLVAGVSGAGKSCFAKLLTERMSQGGFEFCVIDPEGDYLGLRNAVTTGSSTEQPVTEDALRLLLRANINVAVNVLALAVPQRRTLLAAIFKCVGKLRAQSGRPHWLIVDEAHQLLPPGEPHLRVAKPEQFAGTILLTVDPTGLAPEVLHRVDVVLVLGQAAPDVIAGLAARLNVRPPDGRPLPATDEMVWWQPRSRAPLRVLRRDKPCQAHNRHTGKYAIGDVGEQASFYFRAPNSHLRAGNLSEFLKIAGSIPESVWMHHLRARDFSAWFRNVIRDDELADSAAVVEADHAIGFIESRARIGSAICERYILA